MDLKIYVCYIRDNLQKLIMSMKQLFGIPQIQKNKNKTTKNTCGSVI